jgi:hypothetical protein
LNRIHPDPLTRQLLDHTYGMDHTAFPLKERRPPPSRADRTPTQAVVLVDRAWAGDLDYLQWRLEDHGIPVMRFDPETVHQHEVLLDPGNRVLHVDGVAIAPTVLWIRDFDRRSVPACAQDPLVAEMYRSNWHEFVTALRHIAVVNVNPQFPSSLEQQSVARSVGFHVPFTVWGNAQRNLRAAHGDNATRLVLKSPAGHWSEPSPGVIGGAFVALTDAGSIGEIQCGPVVCQEFVDHETELRIFVASETVVAYRVAKPSVRSIWTEPDSVEVKRIRIEPPLRKLVVEFARRCRIDIAALDVLRSRTDGPVFLEANPNGCWWWFEERARAGRVGWRSAARFISRRPVTSAVVGTLSRLHRTAGGI